MVIPPPNVTGKLHLGYLVDDEKVGEVFVDCFFPIGYYWKVYI